MCPHSLRDTPDRCSQCKGAVVQKVTLVDGRVLVDGRAVDRGFVPATPMEEHARRGGKR